jgi:hypothetical protein
MNNLVTIPSNEREYEGPDDYLAQLREEEMDNVK